MINIYNVSNKRQGCKKKRHLFGSWELQFRRQKLRQQPRLCFREIKELRIFKGKGRILGTLCKLVFFVIGAGRVTVTLFRTWLVAKISARQKVHSSQLLHAADVHPGCLQFGNNSSWAFFWGLRQDICVGPASSVSS